MKILKTSEETLRKICVVTGSRAEYGLLKWLMHDINEDTTLQLQVIAMASHLSPEFGLTFKAIEEDGFYIDEKIECLLSGDSSTSIVKSMGVAAISIAQTLERLNPDLIVVLGDRYELLPVANSALVMKIPLVHLSGGEITEGAFDNNIRHALTKLSAIHFVSAEEYRHRVIQMGESPSRVFNVGSTVYDFLDRVKLLSKLEIEESLGIKFNKPILVATFHPETLANTSPEIQIREFLDALGRVSVKYTLVFTKSNADTHGHFINSAIDEFVSQDPLNRVAFVSLGQLRYLSLLSICKVVVGNSSSGIIEAPAVGVPTIDVGDRQKGRLRASSVINVACESEAISRAVESIETQDFSHIVNPYKGKTNASFTIKEILRSINLNDLTRKIFHDLCSSISN